MPLYRYKAIQHSGKKIAGQIEAASLTEAKFKLREQGLMVSTLDMGASGGARSRLKNEALMAFTLQLSQLIASGVPLYEALLSLEEQSRAERYHPILLSLTENVRSGMALSAAMTIHSDSFDSLYRSLIAAGEASGNLHTVLERLRVNLQRQLALQRQLITALIYPALLGSMAFGMILLLLCFVVPSLESMFEGRPINGLTYVVLSLSGFLRTKWPFYLPAMVALVGALTYYGRREAFRIWIQKQSLRLPIVGKVLIEAALARFSRTLHTLLEGGVTLVEALRLGRGSLKCRPLEEIILHAEGKIVQGSHLSAELKQAPLIPKLVCRMIAIGEDTGSLSAMFGRIAEMYEQEVEKNLIRLTALAQPLILVIMGVVVGAILLAVLLPLLDISGLT